MTDTPKNIATIAAEVRSCLVEALAALDDPTVLEEVARLVRLYPEIAWEPVAIAAAAINAKRELETRRGNPSGPVPVLPLPSSSDDRGSGGRREGQGVSLPCPPPGF